MYKLSNKVYMSQVPHLFFASFTAVRNSSPLKSSEKMQKCGGETKSAQKGKSSNFMTVKSVEEKKCRKIKVCFWGSFFKGFFL